MQNRPGATIHLIQPKRRPQGRLLAIRKHQGREWQEATLDGLVAV